MGFFERLLWRINSFIYWVFPLGVGFFSLMGMYAVLTAQVPGWSILNWIQLHSYEVMLWIDDRFNRPDWLNDLFIRWRDAGQPLGPTPVWSIEHLSAWITAFTPLGLWCLAGLLFALPVYLLISFILYFLFGRPIRPVMREVPAPPATVPGGEVAVPARRQYEWSWPGVAAMVVLLVFIPGLFVLFPLGQHEVRARIDRENRQTASEIEQQQQYDEWTARMLPGDQLTAEQAKQGVAILQSMPEGSKYFLLVRGKLGVACESMTGSVDPNQQQAVQVMLAAGVDCPGTAKIPVKPGYVQPSTNQANATATADARFAAQAAATASAQAHPTPVPASTATTVGASAEQPKGPFGGWLGWFQGMLLVAVIVFFGIMALMSRNEPDYHPGQFLVLGTVAIVVLFAITMALYFGLGVAR